MFLFGPGVLIGTLSGANQTPINFGLVQEVSLDISVNLKELYGQNQYPLAIGAGTRKVQGKAKMARVSGMAAGLLFFGAAPASGQTGSSIGEAGTIPATPYTITVANSANWTTDLGVIDATTGLPLMRVASSPTTGQYSVAAGVYTFAAADTTKTVYISYNYTISATGQKILVGNPLLGANVNFAINWSMLDPTTGNQMNAQVYNCVASKLTMGSKLEDFLMPEIDFECYANAAGNIMQWNFADTA